jgi:hypothetical protein
MKTSIWVTVVGLAAGLLGGGLVVKYHRQAVGRQAIEAVEDPAAKAEAKLAALEAIVWAQYCVDLKRNMAGAADATHADAVDYSAARADLAQAEAAARAAGGSSEEIKAAAESGHRKAAGMLTQSTP